MFEQILERASFVGRLAINLVAWGVSILVVLYAPWLMAKFAYGAKGLEGLVTTFPALALCYFGLLLVIARPLLFQSVANLIVLVDEILSRLRNK